MSNDLPIFVEWMDFLKWLLITTEKFPKRVRFTISDRMNALALDIVEGLVEARYTANKVLLLRKVNIDLEKLRILLRICYETQILPQKGYESSVTALNKIGKGLGGWAKQQETKGRSDAATERPL